MPVEFKPRLATYGLCRVYLFKHMKELPIIDSVHVIENSSAKLAGLVCTNKPLDVLPLSNVTCNDLIVRMLRPAGCNPIWIVQIFQPNESYGV